VKKLAFAAVCTLFCASAVVQAQDDLKISGKAEIYVNLITKTDNNDPAEFDSYTDTVENIDLAIRLEKKLSDTIMLKGKLDTEDSGDDDDLIEEAYVVWSKAIGEQVDLAFGRKELMFGQDVKLWENEGNLHAYAEEDNKLALEFGIQAHEMVKLYLTTWQAHTGTWDEDDEYKARDSFLFQSIAFKAEIEAMKGLQVNISYLNEHDDALNFEDADTVGLIPDQTRIGVGVDFTDKELGLRVFFEYMMITALDNITNLVDSSDPDFKEKHPIEGNNGSVMQIGVKYKVDPKVEVGLMFETFTAEVDNEDAYEVDISTGPTTSLDGVKTNKTQIVVGVAYYPDSKNPILLEYVMNTDAEGETGESIITVGTQFSF
jgi:hypothetical protein